MIYGMLLWPHANSRYQDAVKPLALGEMALLLRAAGLSAQPEWTRAAQTDILLFEAPALTMRQMDMLRRHSAIYLLCQMEGDLLRPLWGPADPFLGQDISGILKYKGKTNEAFTRLLMNYALCAGDFAGSFDQPLRLLDPMCGRGTALFEGLNRGYHAYGADVDRSGLEEGRRFLKRYLEYHRIKHKNRDRALTLPGGKSAQVRGFEIQPRETDPGESREAAFICQDAALAAQALPKQYFHLAVCDLPYGVQHAPGGKDGFDPLLARVLPQVYRVLKPGGAVALSFNTYTLPSDRVKGHLAEAGFQVCQDAPYGGLTHWVEQAILRDVAVGVKRSH